MPKSDTFTRLLRGNFNNPGLLSGRNSKNGSMEMLDAFVRQYGPDASGPDGSGLLCMLITHQAEPYLIERLLESGANPNAPDADGESPLALACKRLNPKIIELLLRHKADPLWTDVCGRNLVAIAAKHVSPRTTAEEARSVADSLVFAGACVNGLDQFGRSALFHAVAKGSHPMTEALLAHGADPGVVDRDGIDLWTIARMTGKAELSRGLLAALEALYLSQSITESAYQEQKQKAKANRL